MALKDPKSLRSYRWYGPDDLRSFGHRSRAASMGCVQADYAGKPVIAIINTWSDINPCHSHLRERANDVKRGVWQAGGFPVEMPAYQSRRNLSKTHHHDVSQPAGHGDRGNAALLPGRWLRAVWEAATRPRPHS